MIIRTTNDHRPTFFRDIISLAIMLAMLLSGFFWPMLSVEANGAPPVLQVNVPYWPAGTPYPSRAVFWFGQVDRSSNYTDVRLIYDDTQLKITAHIIDRQLRYDKTPTPAELPLWDTVSLYVDTQGNLNSAISNTSYRFDAEVNWYEDRSNYQAAYTGNSATWIQSSVDFTATTGWRGDAFLTTI